MSGTAMAKLEIELKDELIEKIRRLAACQYGDAGDASIGRVTESALAMRLFWIGLVESGGDDIDETLTDWDFPTSLIKGEEANGLCRWLFRGGSECQQN